MLLYFCAGTTYRMQDVEKEIDRIIRRAAAQPYEALRSRHVDAPPPPAVKVFV